MPAPVDRAPSTLRDDEQRALARVYAFLLKLGREAQARRAAQQQGEAAPDAEKPTPGGQAG